MAEALATLLRGKIKIEDAGFDWKVQSRPAYQPPFLPLLLAPTPNPTFNKTKQIQILGPDVQEFEYVAWTADQDAYAYSGQKCSAQSIVFAHENWVAAGIEPRLKVRGGVGTVGFGRGTGRTAVAHTFTLSHTHTTNHDNDRSWRPGGSCRS